MATKKRKTKLSKDIINLRLSDNLYEGDPLYQAIKEWIKNHTISGITIEKNEGEYVLNAWGDIDLNAKLGDCEKLPYRFGHVRGKFDIGNNQLKTLKNCPTQAGNFDCSNNLISSLAFGPQHVSNDYICSDNFIENLTGAPTQLGGWLIFYRTNIESIELHKNLGQGIAGSRKDKAMVHEAADFYETATLFKILKEDYPIIAEKQKLKSLLGAASHKKQTSFKL